MTCCAYFNDPTPPSLYFVNFPSPQHSFFFISIPNSLSYPIYSQPSYPLSLIKTEIKTYPHPNLFKVNIKGFVLLSLLLTSNRFSTPIYPANIYLSKVDKRNTRKRCEICSKLTRKTSERCLFLVFLFLTLNK